MFKNLRTKKNTKQATRSIVPLVPGVEQDDDDEDDPRRPTPPDPSTSTSTTSTAPRESAVSSEAASSLPSSSIDSPSCKSSSLLEELADALIGAVAVNGMADVRSLLRRNQNQGDEKSKAAAAAEASASSPPSPAMLHGDADVLRRAMELPISRSEMMQLLQSNLDVLHQNKIPANLYLSLLDSLRANAEAGEALSTSNDGPLDAPTANYLWRHLPIGNCSNPVSDSPERADGTSRRPSPSVYVAVFDDENSNKELVYYIAVDEERKLLKVVFRGSVTVGDWMADLDSRMATVPNPVLQQPEPIEDETITPTVSIHQGFYNYLFKASTKNSEFSKYDTIVGHLKRLLVDFPEYKIRVSGHSLGGALSTVFAFVAAADPNLPKPLTCVSFGSPRVGNLDMARAHQYLERRGWLRSIRVVNDKDVITHVPDRLAYAVVLTNSIYRHVGIELKLYPCGNDDTKTQRRKKKKKIQRQHRPPRIHFPTCHPTIAQHMADDASRAAWNWFTRPMNVVTSWRHDFGVNHSFKEYSDRLSGASNSLHSRTLDDLMDEYMAHCRS